MNSYQKMNRVDVQLKSRCKGCRIFATRLSRVADAVQALLVSAPRSISGCRNMLRLPDSGKLVDEFPQTAALDAAMATGGKASACESWHCRQPRYRGHWGDSSDRKEKPIYQSV